MFTVISNKALGEMPRRGAQRSREAAWFEAIRELTMWLLSGANVKTILNKTT
jgi:hypothetical protein